MTTNDTRTAQERAEEQAAKTYPISDNQRVTYQRMQTHLREAFRHGYLARDAEQNAKLEAVLALHKPGRHVVAPIWGDGRYCLECNNWAETEPVYEWPCATVRAIEAAS